MRSLIYFFGGLVVVFTLLILVNYIGSFTGSPSGLPGQAEEAKPESAEAMAQQALAAARAGGGGHASMIPVSRQGLSTAAINSGDAIMLVKDSNFSGVAEQPKDMLAMLGEMAGGKKKPAPIRLSDSDLDKKIRNLGGAPAKEPSLKKSSMPELGRGAGEEGVTLLTVPVDYKIFKSSETWWSFANSRKLKPAAHDFSSADLLILISLSDFPSGIFSVAGVERGKKETVVKYRVNPLAMGADAPKELREAYASAPVPKSIPVRLQQVP